MKVCTKCKIEKSVEDFGKDKKRKDGLRCWCKQCNKETHKEYRQKNAKKIKEYYIEYRQNNAKKIKETKKEYCQKNAKKIKEYCQKNAKKIKENYKEYCQKNAKKLKETRKEYCQKNSEKRKEYGKVYYQNNNLRGLFRGARSRAKKKNLPFEITLEWIEQRYTGKCELTGIEFAFADKGRSPIAPSLDRIDSSKGYIKDNVRIICWGLNQAFGEYGTEVYERLSKAYWREQGYEIIKRI